MKATQLSSLAALALAAAMAMPASANIRTDSIVQDVQSAIGGGGQVNVSVRGGVATLTGYLNDRIEAQRAVAAAAQHDNVNKVVNRITIN